MQKLHRDEFTRGSTLLQELTCAQFIINSKSHINGVLPPSTLAVRKSSLILAFLSILSTPRFASDTSNQQTFYFWDKRLRCLDK